MPDPVLQPTDRVLFEGDSLTDGLRNHYARLEGWDRTWGHLADTWLFVHRPDLDLATRNLAVGGSTAETLLGRVAAAVAFKPTVALLTIGTNDAMLRVPVPVFRDRLDSWCGRLREVGCRRVVHVGGFPPCPHADAGTIDALERCVPYWAAAAEVVAVHGGMAIDVAPYLAPRVAHLSRQWDGHTVYGCGVHYNALGNELISGAVLTGLGMMVVPGGPS